jgi:3-hydroxyacyl-CoA dehydrogenase/3a,7a,12a-trihydroxy-5b-cholest-24-enoyl-CoA hydratase
MATGKADAQKMYFGGKLKISGNVMASQKLDFLKQVDRDAAMKAYAASGAATDAKAPSPAASGSREAKSPAIFDALAQRIAKTAGLAAEIGQVLQFHVKSPDRSFVVDLKSGAGAVREGTDAAAAATLQIDEADLIDLVKGAAQAMDLYQRGKLKVNGDVRLAHKLGFLNNLI